MPSGQERYKVGYEDKTLTFKIPFEYASATGSDKRIYNKQIDELFRNNLIFKQQLQQNIKNKFNEFIIELSSHSKLFYSISNSVALIDVIYHKAKHAKKYNYCKF